jgi:hypothetical protein
VVDYLQKKANAHEGTSPVTYIGWIITKTRDDDEEEKDEDEDNGSSSGEDDEGDDGGGRGYTMLPSFEPMLITNKNGHDARPLRSIAKSIFTSFRTMNDPRNRRDNTEWHSWRQRKYSRKHIPSNYAIGVVIFNAFNTTASAYKVSAIRDAGTSRSYGGVRIECKSFRAKLPSITLKEALMHTWR